MKKIIQYSNTKILNYSFFRENYLYNEWNKFNYKKLFSYNPFYSLFIIVLNNQ